MDGGVCETHGHGAKEEPREESIQKHATPETQTAGAVTHSESDARPPSRLPVQIRTGWKNIQMALSGRLDGLFRDLSFRACSLASVGVGHGFALVVLRLWGLRAGTPASRGQHGPTHGWSQVPVWAFCWRTCWRDRLLSSGPAVPRLAESPGSLFNQVVLPLCLPLTCAALDRGPGVDSRQTPQVMLDETAGPGAAEGAAFYVHPSAKGGQSLSDTGIGQGPGAAEGAAFYVHPSAKGGQSLSDTGTGQGPGAAEGAAFYVHPSAKGGQNLSDTGIGPGSLHCAGEGKTARWIETLPHSDRVCLDALCVAYKALF